MTTQPAFSPAQHELQLPGQTAITIGGSSGIGPETARRGLAPGSAGPGEA